MSRREVFKASIAQRVVIKSNENLTTDDWFKDNYSKIDDIVRSIGYSMDDMVDVNFVDVNTANLYFITGQHVVVKESEFRGYVINKGDVVMIDDEIAKFLCKEDEYGNEEFTEFDEFEVSEVCHNEREKSIEYFLKCFVEKVKPTEFEI